MKLFRLLSIIIVIALVISGCSNQPVATQPQPSAVPNQSAQTPAPKPEKILGTPAGTVMTPEYVAAVGRFAYIWGWPLVNNLNRALGTKDLPGPGRANGVAPAAPPGRVSMLTDYISADEHLVTCPNQDTVYGAGFQHVDTIPVVVQVPDFGKRFFVYQISDARTDSFGTDRPAVRDQTRFLPDRGAELEEVLFPPASPACSTRPPIWLRRFRASSRMIPRKTKPRFNHFLIRSSRIRLPNLTAR